MVVILNLCGNGLREGYHATPYGHATPAFIDPAL
jgi:hypothetical protein